jgi:hypothetical protein
MEVTPIEVTDGERAVTAMLTGNHSVAVVLIARMDGRIAELEAVLGKQRLALEAVAVEFENFPDGERVFVDLVRAALSQPNVQEVNMETTELQGRIKELEAQWDELVTALVGPVAEDKNLWHISYVELVAKEYSKEHDWINDEDPSATADAIDIVEQMCADIRAALTKAR